MGRGKIPLWLLSLCHPLPCVSLSSKGTFSVTCLSHHQLLEVFLKNQSILQTDLLEGFRGLHINRF